MNTKLITCLLAALTLATLAQAQEKAQEKQKFPQRKNIQQQRQKMLLRRFDTNQDGKLDEAEKGAMKQHKDALIKKYDADGDGVLNAEERKAMMEERRKERQAQGVGRGERGRQPRFTPEQRREMVDKFDKDGDGKLSQEERRAAMQARGKDRQRGGNPQKRDELLKKYDLDGDGKLSKEERQKMREDMKANFKKRDAE